MIERHVTFHVFPDKGRDFESVFVEKYRPAMATMPGFVSVELLREVDQAARYQMVIRFQSVEDAAAWRASATHRALQPMLKALYGESQVQVYDVIS